MVVIVVVGGVGRFVLGLGRYRVGVKRFGGMDLYERLVRVFMRRKYSRVEGREQAGGRAAERLMTKSKSVRIPRESRSERRFAAKQAAAQNSDPIVALPKNFTLRSSSNDVIDSAWFNSALRRSVAEGRVTLSGTLS